MRPEHYHYHMPNHTLGAVTGWLTIIFGILALVAGYYAFVKREKY